MSAACTILIPTHNRHQYLDRCVRWFLDLPYPIIIADSSADAWQSAYRSHERVRYIHVPGGIEVYITKLQQGFAAVETRLAAMCADDDFITAEGMAASVGFLDAHRDYTFAQGYAYCFQPFGKRLVVWPIHYNYHSAAAVEWIDRIEQALSTVYYGVNQTEVLRRAFDFLAGQDFGEIRDALPGFVDQCLTTFTARAGKLKRIPVPFGLREYSPYMSAAGTRPATIVSRNVPDFYRHLTDALMEDETSTAVRGRLLRLFSRDYAGQIMYDLAGSLSRKRFVAGWGPAFAMRAEFAYRLYLATRGFVPAAYRPAMKFLWHPEYRRFKEFVLPAGAQ